MAGDMLSQLLPWLMGGSTSDQKGALDIQAKGTNNMQDLVKLLMDPQFAALFGGAGAFDMSSQYQQPTPVAPYVDDLGVASFYLNNPTDPMSEFVAGLVNGMYTPTSAKAAILQATSTEGHPLFGADPAPLQDAIDDAAKSIAENTVGRQKYDAEQAVAAATYQSRDDIFTKAGLPNPAQGYDQSMFQDQSLVNRAAMQMEDAQMGYDTLLQEQQNTPLKTKSAPNVAGQFFQVPGSKPQKTQGEMEAEKYADAARRGGAPQSTLDAIRNQGTTDKFGDSIAAGVLNKVKREGTRTVVDPADLMARNNAKKKAEQKIISASWAQREAGTSGAGAAFARQQAGSSPFNDAVQQRLAMLRAAGLV